MDQESFDRYCAFLNQTLTPARMQHSLGVMQVMEDLQQIYGLDRETALTAGLLHDAAKDLAPEQVAQILQESSIEIYEEIDRDYVLYLHGPVGAYFVQRELGVANPDVLAAIRLHTFYGGGTALDAPLSPLLWCLRFSDVLEPNRAWHHEPWLAKGVEHLRQIVYSGRLEEGAYFQVGWLIRFFEEKSLPIHPNILRVYRARPEGFELDRELGE